MQSRRQLLRLTLPLSLAALFMSAPIATWAQDRLIPQKASARVIVDNDFAGDPDGLAALAHQVLTPKTRTVLLVSSALNVQFGGDEAKQSAERGRDLALELLEGVGRANSIPVVAGAAVAGGEAAEAARAIVAEARRDDALPLYYTCGGPLTNLAAALKLDPGIAERMTVVWIGGGPYPAGGWEYNLATDAEAARYVIEQSSVPLWQVPQNAYRQMQFSIAEMAADLRPISPFTRWLYDRFTTPPDFVDLGGAWPLGDQPLVLLTALSSESSQFTDLQAHHINDDFSYGPPIPGRTVRVYQQLDARLTFGDFLALLRLQAQ